MAMHLPKEAAVPTGEADVYSSPSSERHTPATQPRPRDTRRLSAFRQATRRFVCRLDVCWTFFFFLFLLGVAMLITIVTQRLINPYVLSTWHNLHHLRISAANTRIDQGSSIVDRMAMAFVSMHLRNPVPMESEDTLALACSILANYDKDNVVRAFLPASYESMELIACLHGMADSGSLSTLTGYISTNHTINGTYLVDSNTMRFARPLVKMTEQPPDRGDVTSSIKVLFQLTPVLEVGEAFYNGTIDQYDKRVNWLSPPSIPHLLYYNLPISMAARGLKVNRNLNDFAQVRVDGSRLLLGNSFRRTPGLSIAAFIYQSLNDTDPQVLATSWGQKSVSNNSMFQSTPLTPVTYLTVSGIDDPLMRAALKHVNYQSLQKLDCNETVDFRFRGAFATVTSLTYTTKNGCTLHLVFAGSHAALVGPYLRILEVCNALLLCTVILFTALFWYFMHTQFSTPLRRLTLLMIQNIETGSRVMYTTGSSTWMRLKEVCQLTRAHNRAMRRLQQIEAFIPAAVRNYFNQPIAYARYRLTDTSGPESSSTEMTDVSSDHFVSQTVTAVYLTLRPALKLYFPQEPLTQLLRKQTALVAAPKAAGQRHGVPQASPSQTTPARHPASAGSTDNPLLDTPTVNSGPFTSPAALEAFVEAVHELSAQHHGLVYHMSPDNCVLHFCSATLDAQRSSGLAAAPTAGTTTTTTTASTLVKVGEAGNDRSPLQSAENALEQQRKAHIESAIRTDARSALAFVWALEDRLYRTDHKIEIDSRVLMDTTSFVCGQYRGKHSEHRLSVALGRDVQRDIGPLLPSLKVRVAMTEETARRVRAEWTGRLEPGVRQLPIDAISLDRAGSNKNVVLLYEALRGSVAGDRVWQRYAQRCFEGFSCMLRGEYAEALAAYTRIREISDLEPGLLPACLEREAALSFVTGGAVSVQVDRLMRECRRCVALHITRGYCRTRRVPPGVAAMRQSSNAAKSVPATAPVVCNTHLVAPFCPHAPSYNSTALAAKNCLPSARHSPSLAVSAQLQTSPKSYQRYLVTTVEADGREVRHVLGDPAARIRDNFKHRWTLAQPFRCVRDAKVDSAYVMGMRSSGALCHATQLLLRQVPPIVAKAVKNAPDGFLSDALRSAVPVCNPTAEQCAQLQAVVNTYCTLSHPNLILPLSYSLSVEGAVVLFYPLLSGCTLRELLRRYPRITPYTASRFTLPALTALQYLHSRHITHGEMSLDNVMVAPDGTSALLTRCCGHQLAHEVFAVPRTCYVSPAMAAGAAPTAACDVFCYGLMCVEILSGGKVWKWRSAEEGQPLHSQEELQKLLQDCGKPFMDAVVQGLLIPDTDALKDVVSTNLYRELTRVTVRACLHYDPSQRPTAEQLCAVTNMYSTSETAALERAGLQ